MKYFLTIYLLCSAFVCILFYIAFLMNCLTGGLLLGEYNSSFAAFLLNEPVMVAAIICVFLSALGMLFIIGMSRKGQLLLTKLERREENEKN